MASLTSLPIELRSHIFALAKPDTITITIKESADLAVTSTSSPPALFTTTKESRAEAQKWELTPYSVLVGDDYQDLLFSGDVTLHLIILPSTAEHLSITWTEVYTVLGDALLDAQKVEIECSQPERLARLFMLPEAELVGVGSSCVDRCLFGSEIISSDRETREALRPDISVFVGTEEYVLEEERVEGFFGEEGFETKGFTKRSALYFQDADPAVDEETEALYFQDAEVESQSAEKGSGEELTEDGLARLCAEMKKLFPSTSHSASDPGGSVMPELD
ncbi:hypothetical protein C7974DRAFT_423797 [Boeremia exigua]|uniref:uncharacterized protein n=1 Tax=Boeremia exigua TaxID=749465 RepID=UPI001E8E6057|nr:uncharacterized protein C7974DRAFT_423797 [Boeremia exigua]KAH6633467.1 hypothetical protein C7974DRAFT_423797 [Boeremia exigua]